ncbi:hypothetical protein QA646_05425 [Rhizobium sp. CB3090]|uniref:hypothetical protein n=1 Tax=Rhizobium sp. CB3090 TaxID=3039156 RepID=UPI0024B1E0D1|nr:hypothetical protein [Rhizobium sp. CB3090]WFU10299.1 hypothetical protein QA646_05425 [Rhizobium sp. CB3090]
MNIATTKQDYENLENKLFSDYRLGSRLSEAAKPDPAKDLVFVNEEFRITFQIDYVRGFEDRINRSVALREWFQRQRSKAFSYDETVIQCIFALEYVTYYCPFKKPLSFGWLLLSAEAYRMGLRTGSYKTFLKRVRDLRPGSQMAVCEAV